MYTNEENKKKTRITYTDIRELKSEARIYAKINLFKNTHIQTH